MVTDADGQEFILMSIANAVYRGMESSVEMTVTSQWAPTGLASNQISSDGQHLYVINSLSNNISRTRIVSAETDLPFVTFSVHSNPFNMAIASYDDRSLGWVTLLGHHQIAIVDLKSGEIDQLMGSSAEASDKTSEGLPEKPCAEEREGEIFYPDGDRSLPLIGIQRVVSFTPGIGAGHNMDRLPDVVMVWTNGQWRVGRFR